MINRDILSCSLENKSLLTPTGLSIHGLEERVYKGVRFLYKEGLGSLNCFFSSFSKKGSKQKYNYLKMKDEFSGAGIWFLDSNSPDSDPRGTYFLGNKDSCYLDAVCELVAYFIKISNAEKNVTYCGSSKGGTGAILCALRLKFGKVIVNAPQIKFGSYLNSYSPSALTLFEKDIEYLDSYIENLLESSDASVEFYISCGILDEFHMNKHLESFIQKLRDRKLSVLFLPIPGGHDGEALSWYQKILRNCLSNEFIKGSLSELVEPNLLAFYDRYYKNLDTGIFETIPSIDYSASDNLRIIFNQWLQEKVAASVESMVFEKDFLVSIPDFSHVEKCVYIKTFDQWHKTKKYQISPYFKFDCVLKREVNNIKIFYRGINDKYVINILI